MHQKHRRAKRNTAHLRFALNLWNYLWKGQLIYVNTYISHSNVFPNRLSSLFYFFAHKKKLIMYDSERIETHNSHVRPNLSHRPNIYIIYLHDECILLIRYNTIQNKYWKVLKFIINIHIDYFFMINSENFEQNKRFNIKKNNIWLIKIKIDIITNVFLEKKKKTASFKFITFAFRLSPKFRAFFRTINFRSELLRFFSQKVRAVMCFFFFTEVVTFHFVACCPWHVCTR